MGCTMSTKTFSIDFSLTDQKGNDFHLIRPFETETQALACQESLEMQKQLEKAYPCIIGISIREVKA
mgnify:CR=1 FL=1